MIIHLYLAKKYLRTFLQVFFALLIISYISTISEQIKDHRAHGISFFEAMRLALLLLPFSLQLILPFLILLSACICFYTLSHNSEFVAIRAASLSAPKALLGPAIAVLGISVIATFMWKPFAIAMKDYHADLRFEYLNIGKDPNQSAGGQLWLRQKNADSVFFINIAEFIDDHKLLGVKLYEYDFQGKALSQMNAREARIIDKRWIFFDTKTWDLTVENPETKAEERRALILPTEIHTDLDSINEQLSGRTHLSLAELPRAIAERKQRGLSTHLQELQFWTEIANPLLLLAMLISGATFMMTPGRLAQVSLMGLKAFVFGFAIFFLNSSVNALGISEKLPILVAAFTGPLVVFFWSVLYVLHREDG